MAERENNAMVGALMLLVGGIIGAGIALLYAPQSGDKTRKEFGRYAKKARRKGNEALAAVEEFTEQVSDMAENVAERASDIIVGGRDMAYNAKKGLLKAIADGEHRLMKERARLAKMMG